MGRAVVMRRTRLSIDELRDVFAYDPESGLVTWKKDAKQRTNHRKGDVAGFKKRSGHLSANYLGLEYQIHRLGFALTHGRWPDPMTDHINRDPSDNRLCNLREVTGRANRLNSENCDNAKHATLHKQTGKYQAMVSVGGAPKYLGLFPTEALAMQASRNYLDALKCITD